MRLSFIGLVIGTTHLNLNRVDFSLFAKKKDQQKNILQDGTGGEPIFRIKPYRTISLDLENHPGIKSASAAMAKFNEESARSGLIQTIIKRPTRHYPAHHYKREIKQRKGFQQSEARMESYIKRHTFLQPHDDIKYVSRQKLPRIMEAIKQFKSWEASSKMRRRS